MRSDSFNSHLECFRPLLEADGPDELHNQADQTPGHAPPGVAPPPSPDRPGTYLLAPSVSER